MVPVWPTERAWLGALALCLLSPGPVQAQDPAPQSRHERLTHLSAHAATPAERGELLYAYTCYSCHSLPSGYTLSRHDEFPPSPHLGGGRDMPTVFGTFYAPNISPHPDQGIGGWTEQDFFRALREGRAPDGRAYWPTFPFMAYTQLSDGDISDLWAYLSTQPAVESDVLPHDPNFKRGLAIWRWREFEPGAMEPDPQETDGWNRGRYLVRAVGYCDQCHTPRRKTGFLMDQYDMAGGANPGKDEVHANLTPDPEFGLVGWTAEDWVHFLSFGHTPDGREMRPEWIMLEKILEGYRYLPESDKRAIAEYMLSLEPIAFDPVAYEEAW